MDRARNEEVHMKAGTERGLASRADQRVLRWFGLLERMGEYRMARKVLTADGSGGSVPGRPGLCWMNGMNMALGSRGWRWKLRDNERKIGRSGGPLCR